MSDISKKIFSIEPDIKDVIKNIEPVASDAIIDTANDTETELKLTDDEPIRRRIESDKDPVPKFITEPAPNSVFPLEIAEAPRTAWIGWLGSLLTLTWLTMAGFYYYSQFGNKLPNDPQTDRKSVV